MQLKYSLFNHHKTAPNFHYSRLSLWPHLWMFVVFVEFASKYHKCMSKYQKRVRKKIVSFLIQNECHDQTVRNVSFIYHAKQTHWSCFFRRGAMLEKSEMNVFTCVRTCLCVICLQSKHNKWGAVFFTMVGNTRDRTGVTCKLEFLSFWLSNNCFTLLYFTLLVWFFIQIIKRGKCVQTAIVKIYGEQVNLLLSSIYKSHNIYSKFYDINFIFSF